MQHIAGHITVAQLNNTQHIFWHTVQESLYWPASIFFLGLMDCPCQPPPAQIAASAGQLNYKRVTLPASYSARWDSICTKSIGGGALLKTPMGERAPRMHWTADLSKGNIEAKQAPQSIHHPAYCICPRTHGHTRLPSLATHHSIR